MKTVLAAFDITDAERFIEKYIIDEDSVIIALIPDDIKNVPLNGIWETNKSKENPYYDEIVRIWKQNDQEYINKYPMEALDL